MQGEGDKMATPTQAKPPAVPATAKQGGEIQDRWYWAEASVWTDCMLTALEKGVKGGFWYSLIDKVWMEQNLLASYGKVAANEGTPGVDHVTVEAFGDDWEANVAKLKRELSGGSFEPQAIQRVYIPKPGSHEKRPLGSFF
jgi:RNA-directed DNA polymerase